MSAPKASRAYGKMWGDTTIGGGRLALTDGES